MAASIYHDTGALTVQLYEGQLLPVQAVGDYYQRLGQTGEGSQAILSLGPDCDIVANYLTTSESLARQARALIASWQTKYVRVTEPTNQVFPSVLVKSVVARRLRGAYAHGGTLYTYRVEARFVMAVQS